MKTLLFFFFAFALAILAAPHGMASPPSPGETAALHDLEATPLAIDSLTLAATSSITIASQLAVTGYVLLIALLCLAAWHLVRQTHLAHRSKKSRLAMSNSDSTHETGQLTRTAEEAFALRYLLARPGTDPATQFLIGNQTIAPIGICTDEPASGIDANLSLLSAPGTHTLYASEAIDAGEFLYTGADGKVQDEPSANGTYWRVGRALETVSVAGHIEAETHVPIKFTLP